MESQKPIDNDTERLRKEFPPLPSCTADPFAKSSRLLRSPPSRPHSETPPSASLQAMASCASQETGTPVVSDEFQSEETPVRSQEISFPLVSPDGKNMEYAADTIFTERESREKETQAPSPSMVAAASTTAGKRTAGSPPEHPGEEKRQRDAGDPASVDATEESEFRPFVLMHDNARPHSAAAVTDYLREVGIITLEWPPRSPDLNPIEHVWDTLKKRTRARNPPPANLAELERAVKQEWQGIPIEDIQHLIEGMPGRLLAVIQARGGNTRY
ncbi:uncharacterized protein LOC124362920 [Homalodisca vitripennis]|uniref:uncharacterized protein LOC124362920 n=1 Tax=Homalodisca vitripennis TaxID=197043 RepID=UPI001EEAA6BD|nr:uncharacterized protein LOC124362920 [Homalodisca vitripennis]